MFLELVGDQGLFYDFNSHILKEVFVGRAAYSHTKEHVILSYFELVFAKQMSAVGSQR